MRLAQGSPHANHVISMLTHPRGTIDSNHFEWFQEVYNSEVISGGYDIKVVCLQPVWDHINNSCTLSPLPPAHARLMCREEVTVMDAVVAVTVMECSMQTSSLLGGVNVLHSAFPEDADLEYTTQGERTYQDTLGMLS